MKKYTFVNLPALVVSEPVALRRHMMNSIWADSL